MSLRRPRAGESAAASAGGSSRARSALTRSRRPARPRPPFRRRPLRPERPPEGRGRVRACAPPPFSGGPPPCGRGLGGGGGGGGDSAARRAQHGERGPRRPGTSARRDRGGRGGSPGAALGPKRRRGCPGGCGEEGPVHGDARAFPSGQAASVKFNKGYTALSQSPDENLVSLDSDSDGELESRYSSGYSSAEQVNQDVSRQLLQDGYHLDEIPDDEDLDLIPPKPMASSTCSCCWCCPGDSSSCTLQ
uniref:Family with sequence similarity 219 member B n=1 Tax=Canis lupus familiaris TaxID=9615 RepID=A0A8C0MVD9_CANLF